MKEFSLEPIQEQLMQISTLEFVDWKQRNGTATHGSHTSGQTAQCFTSTRSEIVTSNDKRILNDDEVRKQTYW